MSETNRTTPLYGPQMYYSLFGVRGLLIGAGARLFGRPNTISVGVPGLRHPVHLRLRTTDVALCREIFLNRIYDGKLAEEPQVILDAGANIGLSAVFYATKFPQARVIAIEPEPSNFAMLLQNVAPYSNIAPLQAALWNENGDVPMFDPGTGNTTFRVWGEGRTAENSGSIRGVTMVKLMDDFGIERVDLLKIDIEGAEKEVFGASSSLWIDRVDAIAIEIHDWLRSGCSDSVRMATRGFPSGWSKGEITYFTKRNAAPESPEAPAAAPQFPLKILSMR